MNQFEEISAFRCKQCGSTLKTEAGLRRHETHCKLNPRIDRNQMSIFDYLAGGGCAGCRNRRSQSRSRANIACVTLRSSNASLRVVA